MSGAALGGHHERDPARDDARRAATWCEVNHQPFWMPLEDAALGVLRHGLTDGMDFFMYLLQFIKKVFNF